MRYAVNLIVALLLCFCVLGSYASLSFTIWGDWGFKSSYTDVVANVSDQHQSKFVAAIGDNFYWEHDSHGKLISPMGVSSVNDPKWNRIFEDVYTQPFFQNRWYVLAGNHDYVQNVMAQVHYTKKSKRWFFPSLYYKFTKKVGSATVDFFMLDTTPLYYSASELLHHFRIKGGKDVKQIHWLENQLRASKATWKIVMGHHQIVDVHGGSPYLQSKLVPLFKKYKVSAYINGHIHNVQHVEQNNIHYITQGNAAIQQSVGLGSKPGRNILFSYPTNSQFKSSTCQQKRGCRGFSIFTIENGKSAVVKHFNSVGEHLKSVSIKNRN